MASWTVRCMGKADMAVGTTEQGYSRIPGMTYHNVRAGYAFRAGGEAFFGITNVGDKKPPLFASGTGGAQGLDTVPGYCDVFGRSYFVGATMRF